MPCLAYPLVERGDTPILRHAALEALGYRLLSAVMRAMQGALEDFKAGRHPHRLLGFEQLRAVAGVPEYYAAEKSYAAK